MRAGPASNPGGRPGTRMATTRIKVTRGFWLQGQALPVGAEVDVTESLAIELVSAGKCEYARPESTAETTAEESAKPAAASKPARAKKEPTQ